MQVTHLQASALRKSEFAVRAQAEDVQQDEGGSVDTSKLVTQFGGNSKFASVLAGALQRSGGEEALTSGPERYEEPCVSWKTSYLFSTRLDCTGNQGYRAWLLGPALASNAQIAMKSMQCSYGPAVW